MADFSIDKHTDITELTYGNVHELIDRILVHDTDKAAGTRTVEILYSFVGQVISGGEPVVYTSYARNDHRFTKSIAI